MTRARKLPAAVALGRRGGRVTSPAKAKSSRANGSLGGRPPIKGMTTEQAKRIFWPSLRAITVDSRDEDDDHDRAFLALVADVEAQRVTPAVLDEIESFLSRDDQCAGRIKTAALTLLASGGRLKKVTKPDVYLDGPRSRVLLGERWAVRW